MRKGIYILLMMLFCLPMLAEKQYTVVLDPGHGGQDPGAVGKFSYEKDLNLQLALKVGELLVEQYPEINVVYTRSTDVFVPLQTRADIANKNNADLFISIHANSSDKKEPRGVETFILGTDKMEKNLDVAMRENAVMKLESNYQTTYQGFDPNSIDSYIMFELMQNSHMEQSLLFAEQVQKRFVGHLNREDRGVRQAAFWVLLKTACPSILFEMGFISNPEEEKYLNQPASTAQMANAIVNAFAAYTHRQAVRHETLAIDTVNVKPAPAEPEKPTVPAAEVPENKAQPVTYYALQICASRTLLDPADPKLKGVACEYRQIGDWYKYYAIIDTDRNKVVEKQKEIKPIFPDCWITKFER
ncbi:MAG: N-acetylmuramoyl-L-alanine amidase [Paludibacteraceae bacterium]|nr:N-acetylmuramoyl-L-alanine amidase [Paludibacteraceae bacterium]